MPRRRGAPEESRRRKAFRAGREIIAAHPVFAALHAEAWIQTSETGDGVPPGGHMGVHPDGSLAFDLRVDWTPEQWARVLAHGLLHLAFDHLEHATEPRQAWNAAACLHVETFLDDLKVGRRPDGLTLPDDLRTRDERRLLERFRATGVPAGAAEWGYGGPAGDLQPGSTRPRWQRDAHRDWAGLFAHGLREAVTAAMAVAAGEATTISDRRTVRPATETERRWVLDHFPLLGALAAGFEVIEDREICRRLDVSVAAVNPEIRQIYVNPLAGLAPLEIRFVLAHELLHVALRHHARRGARDPFLWNCAADYVINDWLVEMRIGAPPKRGLLHDPDLRGWSVEEVYDRIARDLRLQRRLETFRGQGKGDLLSDQPAAWWLEGRGLDLDAFYRSALAQGLDYVEREGRGLLPAGLVEEIRAQLEPPIPWDVALARWFDERLRPVEPVRTYARSSRRQSATPDIPRPSRRIREEDQEGRTFAVVLDTSMSMTPRLLGRALGAISSYARARDVRAVRLVYVDAVPYDQGMVDPGDLVDYVTIEGRGGTVLQPAVDRIEMDSDYPTDAPILVITDGYCDPLRIQRPHAFLLPEGNGLPFAAHGPIFRLR